MKTNTLKKFALLALGAAIVAVEPMAHATDPDPTTIYSSIATPFNAGLTLVIGFIAVLTVIKWIRKAVNK